MARIRTIKPEFWKHEELSALPEATHMLAAQLLNYADDLGFFNANPGLIKAECSPLREPSVDIRESLASLSRALYIHLGTGVDRKRYGRIVKFSDHQKVDHPGKSRISTISIVWDEYEESSRESRESLAPEQGTGNREQGKEIGGAKAPNGSHRWSGKIISLSESDYVRWEKSYPNVKDLPAELQAADDYYSQNAPKDGKWFFPVSNWLKKANEDAKPKLGRAAL